MVWGLYSLVKAPCLGITSSGITEMGRQLEKESFRIQMGDTTKASSRRMQSMAMDVRSGQMVMSMMAISRRDSGLDSANLPGLMARFTKGSGKTI